MGEPENDGRLAKPGAGTGSPQTRSMATTGMTEPAGRHTMRSSPGHGGWSDRHMKSPGRWNSMTANDEKIAGPERTAPIVMTLQFDAGSAGIFERQRQAYFPPARNLVPAHLTLFHRLPGHELAPIVDAAAALAARTAPFPIAVAEIVSLGRGVAYRLTSPALERLRADLAERFAPWLTGQDRQRFRPHVTVQNKVDPAIAAATRAALAATFTPFSVTAEGLQLWHYHGGPWAPAGAIGFVGAADRVANRRSR